MESYLSEQAAALQDNGIKLATNKGLRNTLYRLKETLYVIWYNTENTVDKIQKFDQEGANEMFGQF